MSQLSCFRAFLFAILPVVWMPATAVAATEYVIYISVDGLRPGPDETGLDFLQTLIDTGMAPNFQRFQTEGAWTNNARTDFTHTNTIPNHTSMVTGRPVLQPAGQPNTVHHGYTNNGTPSGSATLHNSGNPNLSYIASTFDVAHDAGLSTALYASKSKFVIYEQSYNAANGAPHPNGSDKIDSYVNLSTGSPSNASNLHAAFLADMAASRFNYTFLHYRDPDSAGHASGWGSAAWQNAVKDVDGYLGDVFNLIENDAQLMDKTAIIVTSDHGGTGFGHSSPVTEPRNYTIPFYAWGPGVATGADLYALNATSRLDPGAGRPDYNALVQPIRNADGGNLALDLLGLGPVPGSTINSGQDLILSTLLGDANNDGQVTGADLIAVQQNFGNVGAPDGLLPGDANDDGQVTGADLIAVQQNFGNVLAPAVASVPEPATLGLLLTAGLTLISRPKRAHHPTR